MCSEQWCSAIVSYDNALWAAAREPAFLAGDITCSTEELRYEAIWPVAQNCLVGLYLHTAREKGRDLNYFLACKNHSKQSLRCN